MATKTLDVTGQICPIPVMKTAKAIGVLRPGELLEVSATDPGAVEDIQVFCNTKGHEFVGHSREADVFKIVVKRGA